MSPRVKLHNVRALLHIAKEIEFHAEAAIDAANRVISTPQGAVDWHASTCSEPTRDALEHF
jgi:hypothetical protein